MMQTIDPQAWTEGVRHAYAGQPAAVSSDLSYDSGRVEGELLRRKHAREYEQLLSSAREMREFPGARTFTGQ